MFGLWTCFLTYTVLTYITAHVQLDTPHVWMPPVCFDPPYVWTLHMFGCPLYVWMPPYVWMAPIHFDIAPANPYVWTLDLLSYLYLSYLHYGICTAIII